MSKLYEYTTKEKKEVVQQSGDFYYKNGERLPDSNREGFQTTIFKKQFNPPVTNPKLEE